MIPSYGADGLSRPDGLDNDLVAVLGPLAADHARLATTSSPPGAPFRIPHRAELTPLDPLAAVALHRARDAGDFRRIQRDQKGVIDPVGLIKLKFQR